MPELPEIETVKLQLQKVLVGQTIVRIEQLHPKSLQGKPKIIEGKKVTGVQRYGKMLVIECGTKEIKKTPARRPELVSGSSESTYLAIHFKMSGQLILIRAKKNAKRIVGGHPTPDWLGKLPSSHTRVVFHLKSKDVMYFNDQRIFGFVKILTQKQLQELSFIKNLGKEVWDLSDEDFYKILQGKKRPIKILLMDQTLLSGVGNIYANDALWEAKIHPARKAHTISESESQRLKKGLITVLDEGIKYGGATSADAKYMHLDGLGGSYQDHFRTYHRTGEKCLRNDKGIIKKITLGGRGTYFCPTCQA